MRARTTTLLSITALLAVAVAHALPNKGGGDGDPPQRVRPIRPPAAHAHRLGESVTKNGQTLSRKQIIEKFDAAEEIDIGGKKITVQDLMDKMDKAEAQVATKGGSFAHLKTETFIKPTTLSKITAQQASVATEVQAHNNNKIKILSVLGGGCRPTEQNCAPGEKEKTVKFEKDKGDEDTIAVYTSFGITEQTPDANQAKCTATWDNGVKLMGGKYSLVKFTVDAAGTKKPSVTASAKGALYVIGQSSPIWQKNGSVTSESLDRTFKTPKANLTVELIPLLNVNGSLQAAATLGLRPSFNGLSDAKSVSCSVGIAPHLEAEVDAEASLSIGIPHVADLVKGGVRGQLVVVDVTVPTTLGVKMTEDPMNLGLTFKSDVKSSFLKGKVEAFFEIHDICHWGFCLIEDGLGIPTKGSYTLWKNDTGYVYNVSLADINNGTIPFRSGMPTMKLAQ